jgi:hypothetical protein
MLKRLKKRRASKHGYRRWTIQLAAMMGQFETGAPNPRHSNLRPTDCHEASLESSLRTYSVAGLSGPAKNHSILFNPYRPRGKMTLGTSRMHFFPNETPRYSAPSDGYKHAPRAVVLLWSSGYVWSFEEDSLLVRKGNLRSPGLPRTYAAGNSPKSRDCLSFAAYVNS